MMEEIYKIPKDKNGARIYTGDSITTGAYCDNFKYFIHTVAPYYDEDGKVDHKTMRKCFDSIFREAKEKKIRKIALPALGIGFYGFPMLDYTQICFEKLVEYEERFDEIILTAFSKAQHNFNCVFYSRCSGIDL